MKKRTGDPWIAAADYGARLPQFAVNLIVRSIDLALEFYRKVLRAQVHYSDPDFAALRVLGIEVMLHADHTYEHNPWSASLQDGQTRGLGAELRLLGMNPEEVAERAWEELGVFMGVGGQPATTRVARFVNAFPQYRVHHLLRTAGVESALARLGGVAVAGAAYRGVGMPACIASGRSAARALLL